MVSTTNTSNTQELFIQLTKGEFAAFEHLFKQYYEPLCRHAMSYSYDAAYAEDVVSDVFARIWERRNQLNIDVSVKSYLYRAVSNQCIDVLRNSYHKRVVLTDNFESLNTAEKSDIGLLPETRELTDKIENAIRALPKQCGIIFRLSRDAGLKYQDIAKKLGISVKTVETQMSRAFKSLRVALLTQEAYA